jgi:hypothetical protein
MVSSSEKKVKGRGGSSSGKGGSSGGARMPRGSGDNSRGSDSVLGSPEPHGDILGRPTANFFFDKLLHLQLNMIIKINQVVHTSKNTHMKFKLDSINKSLGQILQNHLFSD